MDDVPDNAIVANNGRVLWCGVNNSVVLNDGERADLDVAVIATVYCPRPVG